MIDDFDAKAGHLAHNVIARMHGRAAQFMGPQAIIAEAVADAMRVVARDYYTRGHDAGYKLGAEAERDACAAVAASHAAKFHADFMDPALDDCHNESEAAAAVCDEIEMRIRRRGRQ